MFDTAADAHRYFVENFAAPYVEMLTEVLTPAISFEAAPGAKLVIGGTRIGGSPDLPPGLEWPRGTKPANANEIAERGNAERTKEMLEHFELGLPYTFFAQVDLSEAATLGPVAADLPREGRLLFFYDMITGPWDSGTRAPRVFWDRSPVASLQTAQNPADLQQAINRYRQASAKMAADYKLEPPSPTEATPYGAQARQMRLKAILKLPHSESLEVNNFPKLTDALEAARDAEPSEFWDAYGELLSYRNQFLGSPDPVQSDPRYDAVAISEFKLQFLSSELWRARRDEIESKAREWRLLLQFDYHEFYQAPADGTVYFLIRDTDLKQRRFDRVISVYQQT